MSTATLISAPASTGPADVIAWQREQLRSGNFKLLGRVWMMILEAARDAHVPSAAVHTKLGTRLEWYNEAGGPQVIGPRIAQTGPNGQLLLIDPIVRADGVMGLPDLPDPTWKPPAPKESDISYTPPPRPKNAGKNWRPPAPPVYQPPKARMIPQHLIDRGDGFGGRARGKISTATTSYLVCGPIAQICIRPMDDQERILPQGLILECKTSTSIQGAAGTLMELLIDAQTGEAFLYGGSFSILNVG